MTSQKKVRLEKKPIAAPLLDWYDRQGRSLLWRVKEVGGGNALANPYHVWLSEIMLQQTTVATVGAYFQKFLQMWPTVEALAAAELDDVLSAWAGLGYYARARNLHKCALEVVALYGGEFPADEAALKALPGIGDYTAAAVAAIAFGLPTAPVDGNIERVFARLHRLAETMPKGKPTVKKLLAVEVPETRNNDFVQALMDLGATVCTPTKPACLLCPLKGSCQAYRDGVAEDYPKKAPKKQKPTRHAAAFLIINQGQIYLPKRGDKGLLAGMREVPTSAWCDGPLKRQDEASLLAAAPYDAGWQRLAGYVRHTFTHFHFEVAVYQVSKGAGTWLGAQDRADVHRMADLDDLALPTLMKKIIQHAE